MPYLSIRTNQTLSDTEQQGLMEEASAHIAGALEKSESYVMVAIESEASMLFAGNSAPMAYLEVKSIGLPESATSELSQGLCALIADRLEIDQGRIYIEFANAERHMWGWSGATF